MSVKTRNIEGDLSGNVAGRDNNITNIYTDPELRAKVAELEENLAALKKVQEMLPSEQIEAKLAALQVELATLRATPPLLPDAASLQDIYLNRLLKEVSRLSLLHIDGKAAEQQLDLAQVYTALLTTGSDEREALKERPMGEKPRPVSALAQLNRHNRLVLLGEPGSGKSTFVNFVALCMAGEILTGDGKYLAMLTTPLPPDEEEKDKKPKPQPWEHNTLLPVKVVLRKFAAEGLPAAGQTATAKHLWDYLAAQLECTDAAGYAPLLKTHFRERGGLVLFDGLDEVAEPKVRGPQLRQVIEDVATCYGHCRVVVTSRPYAYDQGWQLENFAVTTLAPFSRGQIMRFIERWYAYLGQLNRWDEAERARRAEQLQRVIFDSQRQLRGLAERPLLLTLMANLHASRGTLPDKRAELYEETVELLLDRWERGRLGADQSVITPSLSKWLGATQQQIRNLLEDLAFEAHTHQPAQAEGTANLDGERLAWGLMALTQDKTLHPNDLLDYLDQRAGILEAIGGTVYRFPHRTFQEYLAACHLTGRDDFAGDTAALVREDANRWREVALLAGARASSRMASAVWHLVDALCLKPVGDGSVTRPDLRAALIAAQAIVETADLSKVSEANREKVNRVKGWLKRIMTGDDLGAIERAEAGRLLAALGDDRAGAGLRGDGLPEIVWCLVAAGEFIMGERKERQKVKLAGYRIAQYPITNVQYQAFVQADGYRQAKYWGAAIANKYWTPEGFEGRFDSVPRLGPREFGEPYNLPNHPVVGISWYEAAAYCRWLTERIYDLRFWIYEPATKKIEPFELPSGKWEIRLPSEGEWEKAARGTDGREYPWGNKADPNRANYEDTGIGDTSAVGCFAGGRSVYGCLDMAGNVWEWCSTLYGDDPFEVKDEWADGYVNKNDPRVLRGGAFNFTGYGARCAYRFRDLPNSRHVSLGFRVLVSPI